jgi:hypothetical protein
MLKFVLFCLISLQALSAPLELPASKDSARFSEIAHEIGMEIGMTCAMDEMDKLQKKGLKEQDLLKVQNDPNKMKEIERTCVCLHQQKIKKLVDEADGILKRNPKWKGRELVVQGRSDYETDKVTLKGDFSELRKTMQSCSPKK